MGKSSKPLCLVIEASIDGPTFDTLRDQGYTITVVPNSGIHLLVSGAVAPNEVDLFLGPRCWMMTPEVAWNAKLLDAAIKTARAIRYVQDQKAPSGKDSTGVVKTRPRRSGKKSKDSTVLSGVNQGNAGAASPAACKASNTGGDGEVK